MMKKMEMKGNYRTNQTVILSKERTSIGLWNYDAVGCSISLKSVMYFEFIEMKKCFSGYKKITVWLENEKTTMWAFMYEKSDKEDIARLLIEVFGYNEVTVSGKKFRKSDFEELNKTESKEEENNKEVEKESEESEVKHEEFGNKGYTREEVIYAESILEDIEAFEEEYEVFGIRVDNGIKYEYGEELHISHKVMDDPVYDENWELVVERCEEGIYYGMYDLGEYEGTCAFKIDVDSDNVIDKIIKALRMAKAFYGNNIHLIAGDYVGSDEYDEFGVVIGNATCIARHDKRMFEERDKKVKGVYELVKEAKAKALSVENHRDLINVRDELVYDVRKIFVDNRPNVVRWAKNKISAVAVERGLIPSRYSLLFGYKDSKRFPA